MPDGKSSLSHAARRGNPARKSSTRADSRKASDTPRQGLWARTTRGRGSSCQSSTRSSSTLHTEQSPTSNASDVEVVVGFDIGTAETSVAYTISSRTSRFTNQTCLVKAWPKYQSSTIPTELMYTRDPNNGHPNNGHPNKPYAWGPGVLLKLKTGNAEEIKSLELVQLLKLALHESPETENVTSRLKQTAQRRNMKAEDFIRHFLECICQYLFASEAENGYFWTRHPAVMKMKPNFRCVLGVTPALKNSEMQLEESIAIEAGMTNLSMASEPEAVAFQYFSTNASFYEIDKPIIVVDGGGGTVDLITYIIRSLYPLVLDEVAIAEGVLCGSIYLDQRFRIIAREILKNAHVSNIDNILELNMNRFRWFKKGFNGDVTDDFGLDVPELAQRWLSMPCAIIKKHVFDPIVKLVVEGIERQIKSAEATLFDPKKQPLKVGKLVLSGGLGKSPYLFECLRAKFSTDRNEKDRIEIQQLESAENAVAMGLLFIGSHNGQVKQRLSRLSYGLFSFEVYVKKDFPRGFKPKPSEYELGEEIELYEVIDWVIRKGQPITDDLTISRKKEKNLSNTQIRLAEDIYFCGEETADLTYTLFEDLPEDAPKRTLVVDISKFKKGEVFDEYFDQRKNETYYKVEWETVLRLRADNPNQMEVSIIIQNKSGGVLETPFTPLVIDLNTANSDVIKLGTLASRWTEAPKVPISEYRTPKLFGKKRKADGEMTLRRSAREVVFSSRYKQPG